MTRGPAPRLQGSPTPADHLSPAYGVVRSSNGPGRCTIDNKARKGALIEALRANGVEAVAALQRVPADRFAKGCYENGWSAPEILAHVAAIEWTYPKLLELPARDPNPAGVLRRNVAPEVGSRMDGYNARQVEKRSGMTVAELVAEFQRNRATTIAAMEAAEPAVFGRAVESFGGFQGALADVIEAVAVQHVRGHAADLTG